MRYLLAIDQGTSSSRAILFNEEGGVEDISQKEIALHYPQSGWVEHDPQDLIDGTVETLREIAQKHPNLMRDVVAAGITNQRETVIVWDRYSGEPVYNAIVWQDRRTEDFCTTLKGKGFGKIVQKKTGLRLDPYFSATKIRWILQNVEGARERAEKGELIFGTVDSYLIWSLTRENNHVIDSTNASRTLLYNIFEKKWDKDLFKLFDIPIEMAPEIRPCSSDFGHIKKDILDYGLVISGVAGDQQSALIGQNCVQKGMAKSTYGTGCFLLMNMGEEAVLSEHEMLTTIACDVGGEVTYALEGSILNAGTAIQFLRDNFSFFEKASDTLKLANLIADNGGVYFVPAFTGLGAPYWNAQARGVIYGLERDTKKEHVVRAALEAQAYQTRDLISAMVSDSGQALHVLRVDGGLARNEFMCQFLADQLEMDIEVPEVSECTAWGTACLAGLYVGVFKDLDDLASSWRLGRRYKPQGNSTDMDALYTRWSKIMKALYA